ncbi:hypothetical protein Btru_002892 [Bulinus truncatus]|nr:hypothetical protein Btru_002892 [Bulinus truncatus]
MKYRKNARKRRKLGDSLKNSELKKTDMKLLRRFSERRKVDSAYETDKSSSDPYDLNMIDELVNEETKRNEKKGCNRSKTRLRYSQPKKQVSKKPEKGHGVNSTSTPVLQSGNLGMKQRYSKDSSSVTPEVTPILPSKPFECASPLNSSFVTPQLPRSVRKCDSENSELLNISKQLTYSSHTDSGIDLNPPPPVKKKLTDTLQKWSLTKIENQKKRKCQKTKENNFVNLKVKTEKPYEFRILFDENKKNKSLCLNSRENVIHQTKQNIQDQSSLDSCFGFDSMESPQSSCSNIVKRRKKIPTPKISFKDSSNSVIKENLVKSSSPPYFSEEIFSEEPECLPVNKSSAKTYKPTSSKKLKSRLSVSKIDAWAANLNMEIEEAERFDLNVE